jgi:hypothetical protein
MTRSVLVLLVLGLVGCANKTAPLQVAQVSHDTLKAALTLEAQLCFNVTYVTDVPAGAAATHCTSPTAAAVGLTDALHQQIASQLQQAFTLHATLTALEKTGAAQDWSTFNSQLAAIVTLIQQLQQTPTVVQLLQTVQGAKQ